jgi:colanic acid/amylovoran biosynthesis protein
MSKGIRIYCPGAYTYRNKGDAALVAALISELRRVLPDADISISSDTPNLDRLYVSATVLPPIHGYLLEQETIAALDGGESFFCRLRNGLTRKLSGVLSRVEGRVVATWGYFWLQAARLAWFLLLARVAAMQGGGPLRTVVPPTRRGALAALCDADLVVFAPGGYFLSPHEDHSHWFRHVATLFLARWLRKPIALAPMTIGPFFGSINRYLARAALRGATQIWLREQSSYDALLRLGITGPDLRVTTDIAFLLEPRRTSRVQNLQAAILEGRPRPWIGVSVRHYDFPGHPDSAAQLETYKNSMTELTRHVVDTYGGSVIFVPQVVGEPRDDLQVADEVSRRAGRKGHVHIVRDDLSPEELSALYSEFDAFVGVRMHANIFALVAGVPTLAIAYEPKTRGIMKYLQLERFALDIRTLEPQSLKSKFDELIRERDFVRGFLSANIKAIRSEAAVFATEIGKLASTLPKA